MKHNYFDFMDAWIVLVAGGAVLVILAAPITGCLLYTQKPDD